MPRGSSHENERLTAKVVTFDDRVARAFVPETYYEVRLRAEPSKGDGPKVPFDARFVRTHDDRSHVQRAIVPILKQY